VIGANTSSLFISEVRSFHDNRYSCVASNEGGIAKRRLHLKVEGKMNGWSHIYC